MNLGSLGWSPSSGSYRTPREQADTGDSLSAIHPFQQALLFILFIIGDYSVVSLVMVIVRKRFFREHCTQLLRNDHFRRTNTLLPDRTGMFPRAFTLTPKTAERPKRVGKQAISGPLNGRKVDDYVTEGDRSDSPVAYSKSDEAVHDGNEIPQSDGPSTESSGVDSGKSSETMVGEKIGTQGLLGGNPEPHTAPPALERTQKNHGETAVASPTPSKGLNRERTIQIAEPLKSAFQTRQLVRSRTRPLSAPGSPMGSPLRPDANKRDLFTAPTIEPTDTWIPDPSDHMHSGFGGFPHAAQLLYHAVPSTARDTLRRRLTRPERRMSVLIHSTAQDANHFDANDRDLSSEESWKDLKSSVARWMPDNLGGLVIGRNSRFFTEELDDEQLEQVGGVEYRALRLLVYIVGGVSRVREWSLLTYSISSYSNSSLLLPSRSTSHECTTGIQHSRCSKAYRM